MGATVIVHCQDPLNKLLLRCSGINGIANSGAKLPHFDYHAPLLNLPVILNPETALPVPKP